MNIKKLLRFLPIGLLITGFVFFFVFGGSEIFQFETLKQHHTYLTTLVEQQTFLMLVVYTLAYSIVVAFSIPIGLLMTVTGGFLFGTILGTVCVVFGATLGACVLFLAARTAFADLFRHKVRGWIVRFEQGLKEDAFHYLLVLRFGPFVSFLVGQHCTCVIRHSFSELCFEYIFRDYSGVFVYASLGNGLGALLERGEAPNFGIIFTPEILIPIVGLAILAFIPIVYRRYVKSVTSEKE